MFIIFGFDKFTLRGTFWATVLQLILCMMIVLVVVERKLFKVLFLLSFLCFRAEAYAEKSEFILPFFLIFLFNTVTDL